MLGRVETEVKKNLGETLGTHLETTREVLNVWIHDRKDDIKILASFDRLKGLVKEQLEVERTKEALLGSPAMEELRSLVRPILDDHEDLGFFIIAPDHANLASMYDANIGMKNLLSGKKGFLEKIFTGETVMSTPIPSEVPLPGISGEPEEDEPTMFVGTPIYDEDGKIMAALAIRLNPSRDFTRVVQIPRVGYSGEAYAFNAQGMLITESRFEEELRTLGIVEPGKRGILSLKILDPGGDLTDGFLAKTPRNELPFTRMAASALKGETGMNLDGYRDYRGVTVVGTWVWDKTLGFGLAMEIDFAEAYGPFHNTRRLVLMLLGITVVMFFASAINLISRRRMAIKAAAEMAASNLLLTREIGEREKVEAELWKSRERLHAIVENAAAAIYLKDIEGKYQLVNKRFEKFLGLPRKMIIGKTDYEILPGEIADSFAESDKKVFETNSALNTEETARHGGDIHAYIAVKFPLHDPSGIPVAVCGISTDITEEKRIQEELLKSRQNLAKAQAMAHVGSWEVEIPSGILHVSEEAGRILGVDSGKTGLFYEALFNMIHQEDAPIVRRLIDDSMNERKPCILDFRVIRPDGSERIIHGQAEPAHKGNGFAILEGTIQDITELTLAEKEIRRLAKFPAENPEPVMQVTKEGSIKYVNRAGKPLLEAWNCAETMIIPEKYVSIIKEALAYGEKRKLEHSFGERTYMLTVMPITETGYAYIYGHDITDRKNAEKAIHQSREQLQAIIDNTTAVIYMKDRESRFLLANRQHELLFNRSRGEIIGKTDYDFFPKETADIFRENDRKVMTIGEPLKFEESIRHEDGMHTYLSVKFPIKDMHGMTYAICGVSTDITERIKHEDELKTARTAAEMLTEKLKKALSISEKLREESQLAMREAEKANRAKTDFIAGISHEIRTPMNAITGMTELISSTSLTKEQKRYVKTLTAAGETLMHLINDILDISKVEAGQITLEKIPFEISELGEGIMHILEPSAREKGLSLEWKLDAGVRRNLVGDPARLRQVFFNLVGNAIKFTDEGKITVSIGHDTESGNPGDLLVSVSDTGIGIPEEKHSAIFESFTQADSGISRKHGGTGLGLAISKRIVELMGGRIWLTSKPCAGSTFYFTASFGTQDAKEINPPPSGMTPEKTPDSNTGEMKSNENNAIRVLLAEDIKDNRVLVRAFLKKIPCLLDEAESGEAAIEKFVAGNYDIVLMDLQMPGMDGFTATGKIRDWEKKNRKNKTPIIALTAHTREEDVKKSMEAGCDDHISKPIKKNKLLETLMKHTGVAHG